MSLTIVQVNTTAAGGGAAAVVRNLHDGYRAAGHDAFVAVGRQPGAVADTLRVPRPSGGWAGRVWRRRDALADEHRTRRARAVRALVTPLALADERLGREDFRFPGTRDLLSLVGRRPDVLQLHNLHGEYFDLRALPELSASTEVVLSPHDAWLATGHCAHTFDCDRWLSGCGRCPYLDTYPAVRRDATAFNSSRKKAIFGRCSVRLVTPSHWLLQIYERSILADAVVESRVIPHGVDPDRYSPGSKSAARRARGLPDGLFVAVCVAHSLRTNQWKDLDLLRRVVTLADRPIVVIGLGDEGPAERLGRSELRYAGEVPPEVVVEYLRAADVFVHPAKADTFPLAVIEALACGTPVVASAVGGIPEQVADGVTGFLVPPGDERALGAALTRLVDDPILGAGLGVAAARDAHDRFDVRRQVRSYLGWYEDLRRS